MALYHNSTKRVNRKRCRFFETGYKWKSSASVSIAFFGFHWIFCARPRKSQSDNPSSLMCLEDARHRLCEPQSPCNLSVLFFRLFWRACPDILRRNTFPMPLPCPVNCLWYATENRLHVAAMLPTTVVANKPHRPPVVAGQEKEITIGNYIVNSTLALFPETRHQFSPNL